MVTSQGNVLVVTSQRPTLLAFPKSGDSKRSNRWTTLNSRLTGIVQCYEEKIVKVIFFFFRILDL